MQFIDDQAASRLELESGVVLTKCDQCRQMYAERTPSQDPPCKTCFVELLPENEDAARIFFVVRYQFIMGPMGPIDINQLAIYAAMDLYRIKDRQVCFHKILNIGHWWLEKFNKKQE